MSEQAAKPPDKETVDINLKVLGVTIQGDEYRMSDGSKIGEMVFWRAEENEAEVMSFKRAKAKCRLYVAGQEIDFKLIAMLRSNNVRIHDVHGPEGFGADAVARIMRYCLGTFWHKPGYRPMNALVPFWSRDPARTMLCKSYDTHWIAGVLKDVSDEKDGVPFSFTAKQLSAD